MKALLLGATGLIGGFCLEELLNSAYDEIIVAVRKEINLKHPKLKQVVIKDFAKLDEHRSIFSAEHIYCCIGTTIKKAGSREAFKKVDLDIPATAAKLGAEQGAKAFLVVSSIGASTKTGNFYLHTKGEMEAAVSNSGINSVHIFRPSLLLGPRKEVRFGEKIGEFMAKLLSPFMVGKLKKYKPIEAKKVAETMVSVTKNKAGVFIYESDEISAM